MLFNSASLFRQVAAAVALYLAGFARFFLQIDVEQFRAAPRNREQQRLSVVSEEAFRQGDAFNHRALADAEISVDEGRIDDMKISGAMRRSILVNQGYGALQQRLHKALSVGQGGGGKDELRLRAEKGGNPFQAADDICQVRTEHAAVDVHLVDDDIAQVGKEGCPHRVMRQDAQVQHIGIGKDEICLSADELSLRIGRVTVVNACVKGFALASGSAEQRQIMLQFLMLVLRQRLGGIDQQRSGSGIDPQGLHNWNLVGETLAAGDAGADHQVSALQNSPNGICLMFI